MAAFYFNTNISAFITILLKNRYGCLIMHIIIDELSMQIVCTPCFCPIINLANSFLMIRLIFRQVFLIER